MDHHEQEAHRAGTSAGRDWVEQVIEPYLRRAAAGQDTTDEMGQAMEVELVRRMHIGASALYRAGLTLNQVEQWQRGVALGAGWRARELVAQIAAANN